MKDTKKESTLQDVVRTHGLIQRYMTPYFQGFGISSAQWSVLRTLDCMESRGQTSVRLNELSEELLIQPPSVTGVIDRLERDGLVSRVECKEDRRARNVALTQNGKELVEGVKKDYAAYVEKALKVLEDQEQAELKRLLDKLGTHIQAIF